VSARGGGVALQNAGCPRDVSGHFGGRIWRANPAGESAGDRRRKNIIAVGEDTLNVAG